MRPFVLRLRNTSVERVVGIGAAGVVIYLLLVPIGMLVWSSVRATKDVMPWEATSFTLSNYVNVFTSELTIRLLLNTLQYAVIAIVLSIGIAVILAWFMERTSAPWRRVLIVMVLAPLGVPPIVEIMAWIMLVNPSNGIFNEVLRQVLNLTTTEGPLNIYTFWGLGFVTGLKLVPGAYILIASAMARLDPTLEEASTASGASPFTTFRRITGELMRPAVLAVVILFTVMTIEMFEGPAMLLQPKGTFVFATLIYAASHPLGGLPNYGLASSYAMISLMIGMGLIYIYHIQVRRQERFAVVTGKAYRPRLVTLPRVWQVTLVGAIVMYVVLVAVLPTLVLIWGSLGILYTPTSLASADLENYVEVFGHASVLQAVSNTLIISVVSATATMVLALVVSWLAVRSGFRGSSLPDRMTILSMSVPGIVMALAFIFFYTRFPLPVYGTIWIIAIAYVTRNMAFSCRLMNVAYLQIHRELEEASAASGAGWLPTIRHVVLPIVWPAFIRGWLLVFVHSMRDVTLALMLYTVDNGTLAVALWQFWMVDGDFGLGAALSVPLLLFSLGITFAIARPAMVRGIREVH